jgi:prephenate dehydrogenase
MVIGIVGIGLIGGSMALALKERGFATSVIGVDNNPEHLEKARSLGIIDSSMTLADAAKNSDIVIIATPVNVAPDILGEVLDIIDDSTVVIDVGSTKESIYKKAANHPRRDQFVACHPIAGTEYTGPEAAFSQLFDEKVTIICNSNENSQQALNIVQDLFSCLKMKEIQMDAIEHDRHIAFVSHLSHITSFTLGLTVLDIEKDEKSIFNMAGSGFASTVRLAKSSPEMWVPIFQQNSKNLSVALGAYIEKLKDFKKVIDQADTDGAYHMINEANKIRRILNGIEEKEPIN